MALPKYLENLAEQSQYVQEKLIAKYITTKVAKSTLTDQDVMDVCELYGYDYAVQGDEVRKQLEDKRQMFWAQKLSDGNVQAICQILDWDFEEKKDYVRKMLRKNDTAFKRLVKEHGYYKMKEEDARLTKIEDTYLKNLDASTGNPLIDPEIGFTYYKDLESQVAKYCADNGLNYTSTIQQKKEKVWNTRSKRRAKIARLEKELGIDPRKDQIRSSDNGSPGTTNALF